MMTAERVHLVRHGEVFNPDGVLYERLPGFALSDHGRTLAQSAVTAIDHTRVTALVVSPLQRTKESVAPWESATKLTAVEDDRVIEPWNEFRGLNLRGGRTLLTRPDLWKFLVNPLRPSWGEPYVDIADRMLAAMWNAADSVESGEVVIVTHQLPISTVHLKLAGQRLAHNPARRRCALSSVTSFDVHPTGFVESGYWVPRGVASATDSGAV
jgi:broad specificity phosphatase PhoE